MFRVHLGHRWTCSHDGCEQKSVSKQSLKRHIERIHTQPTGSILHGRAGNDNRRKKNDGKNELTDNGQMAKIRRLEGELKSKDLIIDALIKAYSSLKEEN